MKLGIINESISQNVINSLLSLPKNLRDVAVDVANTIEFHKIKPFLDQNDLKSAIKKMVQVDTEENVIDFLSKYLNVDNNKATEIFYEIQK